MSAITDTHKSEVVNKMAMETLSLGTTVVNGSMFAIGGWLRDGKTNTVEMWDPRDKSGWNNSSIPSMKEKRCYHSVSSGDDSIFVFGGYSGDDYLNSCESLDIRSNKWKSISSMPLKRSYHSSIVIGDQILIIGGYSDTTQIDLYNTITNTLTTLQHKLLQSRCNFQAFAL
jgi:kelch-like protein 9/13